MLTKMLYVQAVFKIVSFIQRHCQSLLNKHNMISPSCNFIYSLYDLFVYLKGNYCIIEFCDLESVSRCLSSDKKTFHGNKLVIRQRESSSKSSPPSTSLSEGKSKKTNSTTTREDLDTKSTLLNKELETLLSSKPDVGAPYFYLVVYFFGFIKRNQSVYKIPSYPYVHEVSRYIFFYRKTSLRFSLSDSFMQ